MRIQLAIPVFLLVAIHVYTWGGLIYRAMRVRHVSPFARAASAAALGFVAFGVQVLVMGHVGMLRPWPFVCIALAAACIAARLRLGWPTASEIRRRVWAEATEHPVLAVTCFAIVTAIVLSALRPPLYADEKEYHWPAPQFWAAGHRWQVSPFRHTNGPILLHAIYTVSAIWNLPTAAHWTHSLVLSIGLLAAAAIFEGLGAPVLAIIAACLSIPAVVNQSSTAYTDTGAASLVLAAYAALLCPTCGDQKSCAETRTRISQVLAASLIFAGAVSVKPFVAVAVPGAVMILWVRQRREPVLSRIRAAAILMFPVALAIAAWSLRTHALVGTWWDSTGIIVHDRNDVAWQQGWAVGRIPTVRDLLSLPLVPLVAPIFGQVEPYGGRTGPLLLVGLPLVAWYCWGGSPIIVQRLRTIAFAAVAYFVMLAPFLVKTRFHNFVWMTLAGLTAVVFFRIAKVYGRARLWYGAFLLLVWCGMFDSTRILLRGLVTAFR